MECEIEITMKHGSKMVVTAESWGSIEYMDTYFRCYWPGKKRGRIIPESLYDVSKAYDDFIDEISELMILTKHTN